MEMAEDVTLSTMSHRTSTHNDRTINNPMGLRIAIMAIITAIPFLHLVGNPLLLEPADLPVALHPPFPTLMAKDSTRDLPDTNHLRFSIDHSPDMGHLLDDMTTDGMVVVTLIEEVIEDNIKSGLDSTHHESLIPRGLRVDLIARYLANVQYASIL